MVPSYIYLDRFAEKQVRMLIKATLLTELTKKKKRKKREKRREERKKKKDLKGACGILRDS